jgi:peroxiredoxin Q/BCP
MERFIPVGASAPDFDLLTDDGGRITLSGLKGRKLALYFYPKADTPGCTQEAVDFNRLKPKFEAAGTSILGVSADPVPVQARFRAKYKLVFPLASDPSHRMLEAYGVWGEKSLFGRKFMGVRRVTYLIDADGRVAKVWPNVKVPGHANAVLAEAKKL